MQQRLCRMRPDGGPSQFAARIPLALQSVFLNGNRGVVVNTPPPEKAASKTFRGWWRRRGTLTDSGTTPKSMDKGVVKKMSTTPSKPKKKKVRNIRCIQRHPKMESFDVCSPTRNFPFIQPISIPTLSPQQYLDAMIQSRGYSTAKHETLISAYYNQPTPLQLASYGVYVIELVRKADEHGLQEVMDLGLSPNACNKHGESILHNVCRRGDSRMLDVLLQAGCENQVSDDSGRTPLHDACWAAEPNFPLIEKVLERDIRLLYMADIRGHLPLSYTRQEHWSEWLQFLASKKDIYWPRVFSDDENSAPELTFSMPHSRPIPDPDHALSLELARLVAGAKLEPQEVISLKCDGTNEGPGPGWSVDLHGSDHDSTVNGSDDEFNDDSTRKSDASNDEYESSWNFDESFINLTYKGAA
jgi:hypothetical protein